jgi:hypothetical protein
MFAKVTKALLEDYFRLAIPQEYHDLRKTYLIISFCGK